MCDESALEVGGDRLEAGRADPVAELHVRMLREVMVDALPVVLVGPNALAVAADRQQAGELLHLRERLLELVDAIGERGIADRELPLALAQRAIRVVPLD